MLIKALCDYYDVLYEAGKMPRKGYRIVDISFGIAITPEGELDDVIDIRKEKTIKSKNGKEKTYDIPLQKLFPDEETKSAVKSIVIDYRPKYIFGLMPNNSKCGFILAESKKGESMHDAYIKENLSFIEGIDTPIVNGFRNFLNRWEPSKEIKNEKLLGILKEFDHSCNMEIFLTGHPSEPLQDEDSIRLKWDKEYNCILSGEGSNDNVKHICGITGRSEAIAKTHDTIKGMGGSMGASLVSVNKPSMESYGNAQGANSGISIAAMKKYTSVLNYLKNEPLHYQKVLDTDVFCWAMNNSDKEVTLFKALCMERNDEKMDADKVNQAIEGMISDAKSGELIRQRLENTDMFDPDVTFFIVGMNASLSRISIEWIVKDKFAEIIKNVAEFQNDLKITQAKSPVPIWSILSSLGSTKSRDAHISSTIVAKTYTSIFKGDMLPRSILDTAVRRYKTDFEKNTDKGEDLKKIRIKDENRIRIIKAYLLRVNRKKNEKEEFSMALDKSNTNPYYVCGQLFAVMEKVQFDGAPELNRTIKDVYFSAAASTPAAIMPKLITLNAYHMKKLTLKAQSYYSVLIQSIIDKLADHFPKVASIEDQGRFMIGYFQQKKDLYTSHKEN